MKEVTRYQCEYCKKDFKTPDRHNCKYDPKLKNCFTCKHLIGWDDGFIDSDYYISNSDLNYPVCVSDYYISNSDLNYPVCVVECSGFEDKEE